MQHRRERRFWMRPTTTLSEQQKQNIMRHSGIHKTKPLKQYKYNEKTVYLKYKRRLMWLSEELKKYILNAMKRNTLRRSALQSINITERKRFKFSGSLAVTQDFWSSRCLVAASNGGRSSYSGFPNCPRTQLSSSHFSRLQLSTEPESESKLLCDRRFTASKFVLAWSPLRLTTRDFLYVNICGHRRYVTCSLTRRWVCHLRIFLAFCQVYVLHI
jgi:hypothetical protein